MIARVLSLLAFLPLPFGPSLAAELVMFEAAGCVWCAAWDRQIGPVYPLTDEGRRAPLRRVDLHGPRPDDLKPITGSSIRRPFVLTEGGREVGRIRGYPGEEFFWAMLGDLIRKLDP